MPQRLVLRFNETDTFPLSEIALFQKRALEYGIPLSAPVTPVFKGEEILLYMDLPKGVRVVAGKRVIVRAPTKKEEAVKEQIKEHREKKAKGEPEAYVPPEGKTGPTKPRKVKCPVCDIRKPVVRISGTQVIKPHIFRGESCDGGGQPAPSASRARKKT